MASKGQKIDSRSCFNTHEKNSDRRQWTNAKRITSAQLVGFPLMVVADVQCRALTSAHLLAIQISKLHVHDDVLLA